MKKGSLAFKALSFAQFACLICRFTENAVTVKLLSFRTSENFALENVKFKQRGRSLVYFINEMLIWVCTVCPNLSVPKFKIITVTIA